MTIQKIKGVITDVKELSPTAKEIAITLEKSMEFIAGSFVNVFMEIEGVKIRRAYSISSSDTDTQTIRVSVRLNPTGTISPLFWKNDMIGTQIEIMGPLGLNTADKMTHETAYLFGFGIGAGVIKSIAEYLSRKDSVKRIVIMTGNRSDEELLHKDYFDTLSSTNTKVSARYAVTAPSPNPTLLFGYIQNHINDFDFSHSDVYVCGQEAACEELVSKVKDRNPIDCSFFVEGFH